MANTSRTYASMAGGSNSAPSNPAPSGPSGKIEVNRSVQHPPTQHQPTQHQRPKRAPSPAHVPKTESTENSVYVLTLLTDKEHHQRMTTLRNQYFPKRINKLAAHLTYFHALPGSKLESSIIPHIQKVVAETQAFQINAASPFRMKKGIAISVPKSEGGEAAQEVHRMLKEPWLGEGFLSEQDAGGFRAHYTIMNKVDDEKEVAAAFQEVQQQWKGDRGIAQGLALWRYDKGYWKFEKSFNFRQS